MRTLVYACFCLALAIPSLAQSECPLPPALKPIPPNANIFSESQESDLGDAIADSLARDLDIARNDGITAHLTQIGNRLTHYLPPTKLRYQFFLVDLPTTNAFSLPGGRVYISRKVVALAQSEDELAGVIAHELGHIVTRQLAIEMTNIFRTVLGVDSVGDRNDIYEKYFQYLDAYRRKPYQVKIETEEEHQYIADQVAVYALARAGYSPDAFASILDRLEETHGKTGSWFAVLFGATTLSQQRRRELLKNMSAMPVRCAEIRPSTDIAVFRSWQKDVISAQKSAPDAPLPGLILKQTLALPLRPDITSLRFSPDGRYVLAQDDGGVHILTRDPLSVLFFIDAPNAYKAVFAPDSRSVVVLSRSMRVEVWDIATQTRSLVHEVLVNSPCLQSEVSPDGNYFGCLKSDLSLVLLDVSSGSPLIEKKDFFQIRSYFGWYLFLQLMAKGDVEFINMHFSPDGRYFLAGSRSASPVAYDLAARRDGALPGSIRSLFQEPFAFAGPERIIGINPYAADKSPMLRFPTGEKIGELPLRSGVHVSSIAQGDYILVGPLKDAPLGLVDVTKKSLLLSFTRNAGDVYDKWILSERRDGELAISELPSGKAIASVRLSQSRLGLVQAAAVSSEFDRLAVSTKTRGAVWQLQSNIRTHHARSFGGAWFGPDGSLYADFPKLDQEEQAIVRLGPMGSTQRLYAVPKGLARQLGPYLISYQPTHENSVERRDCAVEIRDLITQRVLWSRYFPKVVPDISVQGSGLLLRWSLADSQGREEVAKFPEFKRVEKEDYLFERFEVDHGAMTGRFVVKTNGASFGVEYAVTAADWAAVQTSSDRVLLYSMSTGAGRGHLFGSKPALSEAGNLLTVISSPETLVLYDLPELRVRTQYNFPAPVAMNAFSGDGKRLFVLTRDQTAYILDLTAHAAQ